MSLLQQIIDGSLVSRQRLMQSREFYSPSERKVPARVALARWTNRVLEQPALGVARELAGLSEPELDELEAEFRSCPMRQPPQWVRYAAVVGIVLFVLAGLGLGLQALTSLGQTVDRTLQAVSVACLLIGLLPLGVGLISAFGALHLDLSYGTVGLYVGKLDEQHPWLYDARSLTKHGIAEEYRQRTLQRTGFPERRRLRHDARTGSSARSTGTRAGGALGSRAVPVPARGSPGDRSRAAPGACRRSARQP